MVRLSRELKQSKPLWELRRCSILVLIISLLNGRTVRRRAHP
jgi:hypothetical protein